MYSQSDIDDAVAAGAFPADAAVALRAHLERQRALPAADEEQFRLLTGFNDIFVAIAAAILLFAVGWIGQSIGNATGFFVGPRGPSPLIGLFMAVTAWGLAEFFTARRRMALPSIQLLLAFVGGVFFFTSLGLATAIGTAVMDKDDGTLFGTVSAVAAAVAAGAAFLHWRRFHVPITIAAVTAALAGLVLSLVLSAIGADGNHNVMLAVVLFLGIGVWLFAMRWDSSDPARVTRRSDVAFWLHLLAAPMIVHPVFALLGLTTGSATLGEGLLVIALYVVLAVVALAIDRRALLVSALAYVLFALSQLFRQFGAVELNIALTAFVIGSALLLLSAFWHQARAAIVTKLPDTLRARLPLVGQRVAAA